MAEVLVFRTEEAPPGVLEAARRLCDEAFAGDPDGEFDDDDWAHALGGWHVVVLDDPPGGDGGGDGRDVLPRASGGGGAEVAGRVVAHAAVVERTLHVAGTPFRTGYVEAVATRPGRHGEGLGSLAMIEVGQLVRRDFELGALGTGRWSFYERMGWERWQGPTFVRQPDGTDARSAEDDDGVMVLRFGPSAAVDRRRPIACEARPGDDW